MRGRGLMLVAGMRAGERRGAAQAQQQQAQQAQAQQQQAQQAQAQQQQAQQAQAKAPEPTKDITLELQKLADLHNSGAISDQEFAMAKQKLLS